RHGDLAGRDRDRRDRDAGSRRAAHHLDQRGRGGHAPLERAGRAGQAQEMTLSIREENGAITFDVQVVPRASRDPLGPVVGDRLKVQLTAPPVDGAANEALTRLIAGELEVPRSSVAILRGETGRKKTIRVTGARASTLRERLEQGR